MEAERFGFGALLPPAYNFDPTDANLVAYYLLPRALGIPNPHGNAVIDDDPASCPPWELLRRHGHAGSSHAFFFGPRRDPASRAHVTRNVPAGDHGAGGTWRGQKGELVRLVLACGGGGAAGAETMELVYMKFNLMYNSDDDGGKKTSGWVMHEYQITDPPLRSGNAKKGLRQQAGVPYQDQPDPSN